jgi:hypothetical protein
LLAGFRRRPPAAELDWGVPLAARLAVAADRVTPLEEATCAAARAATLAWASAYRGHLGRPALFGWGLAGYAVGLAHATAVEPRFSRLAGAVRDRVVWWCHQHPHVTDAVALADYDLILGMAGVVLALTSLPGIRAQELAPGLRYLTGLCGEAGLPGLRVGSDGGDPQRTWTIGSINHGLGHGAPGVLAALLAAWPVVRAGERDMLATAIGRIADYLVKVGIKDSRGVLTWPPSSRWRPNADLTASRQAWCYGAPGVAWQLAEAGRVLADPGLAQYGVSSMDSLCRAWDDDYYLPSEPDGSRWAFCHGAAGILATARAFGAHTGLAGADRLARHLADVLTQDEAHIRDLAARDPTMLTGAMGVVSVQLGGAVPDTRWLAALGLR